MDVPNHLRYLDVFPMLFVSTVVVAVAVVGTFVLGVTEEGVSMSWPVVGAAAVVVAAVTAVLFRRGR